MWPTNVGRRQSQAVLSDEPACTRAEPTLSGMTIHHLHFVHNIWYIYTSPYTRMADTNSRNYLKFCSWNAAPAAATRREHVRCQNASSRFSGLHLETWNWKLDFTFSSIFGWFSKLYHPNCKLGIYSYDWNVHCNETKNKKCFYESKKCWIKNLSMANLSLLFVYDYSETSK